MQLFYSPTSPYTRKVMVVLHEVGLLDDVALLPSGGSPLDSTNMPVAQNPLGKVPTLLRDDGPAIYDSRVICRYLDDRAKAGLYPQARLWETLTLEATADGIMDAALLMVYEDRLRDAPQKSQDWVEGQWLKIERALDALSERWLSHLAGPLDMGQIALGCALGYLDFRHANRSWCNAHPALSEWYQGFASRPSIHATVPVG